MLDLLKANAAALVLVLAGILMLVYLYSINRKDLLKKIILVLVVQAEKQLGSGTGALKYAMVVEKIYRIVPLSFRWFLTEKELDRMIEEAVKYLKAYLAQGKNLVGHEGEFYKHI
ncbi:hypothetical protein [Geosporobacter ferrireducens]|uniref:hypothetical protein n=1 Tax=Geosporobacter ferrireducens TaxID=1424294 RepID=UPI00139C9A90|nr:hypothetical protein [Geosporobacter ferrireducens]MTI57498.1 hypothetical protein [Geosporobacter ferrireducens]